jgi:hypothetical protein
MTIGEMQACLARLYVNEAFRKLFYLDPQMVLEGYCLTEEEAAAIRCLDYGRLDQFASSLVTKRRKRVERAYPLLFRLNSAEFRRYYARFYQLYSARPYQSGDQDVVEFGTFLEESLIGADHWPPYASDLARYERMYYWTRITAACDADEAIPGIIEAACPNVVGLDARPSLRPNVTVATFAYDVGAIEDALQHGSAPDKDQLPGGCSVIFRPATSSSPIQMLRINRPTKAVLDCCDGYRTVAQIVTETEAVLGINGLHDRIVETIARLLAEHVIALDGGALARRRAHRWAYVSATQTESM